VLLLAAMGIEASTEAAAEAALERIRRERTERLVAPARVVEMGAPGAEDVVVQLGEPQAGRVRWELELQEESGRLHRAEGEEPHGAGYTLTLRLPASAPLGYHTLRVAVSTERASAAADQSLIVVPRSCVRASELLGGRKAWGLIANLYTVRSDRNWGVGDLTDLADLLEWAGELGAQFVGVNPLHALHNRDIDVSPYSPVSRLFRNPLYIDVERVPELEYAPRVRAQLSAPEVLHELDELREADELDYQRVMDLKLSLLEPLHRVFLERRDVERQHAYEAWCAEREPELTDFATYMGLAWGGSRESGIATLLGCFLRLPTRASRFPIPESRFPPSVPTGAPGRTSTDRLARLRSASSAAPTRRSSTSIAGSSSRPTGSSAKPPSVHAGAVSRSGCIKTSRSGRRLRGATRGACPSCSSAAPASERRPIHTRRPARTGGCRRSTRGGSPRTGIATSSASYAPRSGTPARCASTT